MDQLSNFISEYLKTCETIKKLNSKTIKAYRIDLSQFHTYMLPQEDFTEKTTLNSFLSLLHQKSQAQNSQKENCYFEGVFPIILFMKNFYLKILLRNSM